MFKQIKSNIEFIILAYTLAVFHGEGFMIIEWLSTLGYEYADGLKVEVCLN
ncbi:hypothetical protein [Clostridium senegalense]|uniref:hypothetical protein n=1 Tax=Clostridium senegalense TaxID=1465809 RepID=UPI0002EAEA04|nr:hypothetical protein [Clostridium senegalense]